MTSLGDFAAVADVDAAVQTTAVRSHRRSGESAKCGVDAGGRHFVTSLGDFAAVADVDAAVQTTAVRSHRCWRSSDLTVVGGQISPLLPDVDAAVQTTAVRSHRCCLIETYEKLANR